MKKIVIASDSYKESLTAMEVADCIEIGFSKVFTGVVFEKIAMADGGEGTVDTLISNSKLKKISVKTVDPLFREIKSYYAFDSTNKIAIVEMALSSGLELLKSNEKNPLKTTTYGTGLLIKDAITKGAKEIIVTIGGSATNEMGIGLALALGYKFLDSEGSELEPIGENLLKITTIVENELLDFSDIKFKVACDVSNLLYGKNGAAYVYGKQKGASLEDIVTLDNGMKSLSKIFTDKTGFDYQTVPGSGAAGGLGAGLMYFCNASLESGVDLIMNYLNLEQLLDDSDLLITGEGRLDAQSINGKVPVGCAMLAEKKKIKTIAICGSIGSESNKVYDYNICSYFSAVQKPMSLSEAIENSKENLINISENIARTIKIGIDLN